MEKLKKVKELIIETVKSYNTDWELNLDLTEFIDTVNKTDDLDELDKINGYDKVFGSR